MTREHVKEILPFIQAYAEGKPVEFTLDGIKWKPCDDPAFTYNPDCYRIKPEPTMRPMTRGEVLYKVTTTPGMVVREDGGEANAGYGWIFVDKIPRFEWAIIDAHGDPIDGWHKFEVEA